MKLLCSLLFLFCTFPSLSAQNISDLENFEKAMRPGTVLTYDVNMGGKQYQFIATLKKAGSETAFDWKMTEPVNKSGTVNMSASAVKNADALFNYFTGGVSNLEKETSVFISQKVFDEVAANAEAMLKVNGAEDTATRMSNTISEFNFNLNGSLVAVPGWELEGGSEIRYKISVIESRRFPLIANMNLGWTINLSEIKEP
ncbi:MAG: hypothetical protein KIS94_06720 [Chitinophagales bacterium]|nr:hypothetical protein [Chitinophagales bacterium]